MTYQRWLTIGLLSVVTPLYTWAQEYDFSETVDVSKAYKPVFIDVKKIDQIPSLEEEIQDKKIEVNYKLLSHPKIAKFSLPDITLRPYAHRDSVSALDNYIDLSMGNHITPRAQIQLAHLFANNTLLGIAHQSQFSKYSGGFDTQINSDFLNLNTRLFLAHTFAQKYRLRWDASHDMRVFHYYGLPADSLTQWTETRPLPNHINLEQRVHIAQTTLSLTDESSRVNKWGIYQIAARFRWLKDAHGSLEKKADFNSSYHLSQYFAIGLDAYWLRTDYSQRFVSSTPPAYNNIGAVLPLGVYLNGKGYEFQLGAKVQATYTFSDEALFQSSTIRYFFMPDLHAIYDIAGDLLRVRLDITGSYTVNSYHAFLQRNKYLYPDQTLKDTFSPLELQLGLVGRFSAALTYEVLAHYGRTTYAPSFARVTTPTPALHTAPPIDPTHPYQNDNSFYVFYDDFERYGLSSMAAYSHKNGFKMGAYLSFSKYYASRYTQTYDRPELDFKCFTSYDYRSLSFLADLRYVGERYFATMPLGIDLKKWQDTSPKAYTLSPYIDINMELRYRFNRHFSTYIRGTNLLNKRYQHWKDYPVQGAIGFLGLIAKF